MKQLLITIAALVLVGCGESQPTEPPTVAPEILIHEAARDGNIEAVKQHLAAGTDVNAKGKYEETPLLYATLEGHKEIAELLITKGANVNAEDKWGNTPLHLAAYKGHKENVKLLIAKGADVNAKNEDGETPLDDAVRYKQTEIADLLRKHGGKTEDWFKAGESIHIAAKAGHIEAVKKHLAADVDVDLKANDSWTPLQNAAWFGQEEIAELLVAEGADVNAKDYDGKTPLDLAKRHPEIADLLRKHGGKTGEELKAEGK